MGDRAPRRLLRQTLAEVVEPRYEELFSLIHAELKRSGFEELIAAGVVLTGGGSRMEGVIELAEEVFHMPVRLGVPQYVGGLTGVIHNPIYATGVGLVLHGARTREHKYYADHLRPHNGMRGVISRARSWFQGNF